MASGAAAGLAAVAACVVVWLANPYLALLLVPLVHLVAVLGTRGRRPAALALPVLAVAALPLVAALVYVASELDWGASTPLQLAALMAGGGIGASPGDWLRFHPCFGRRRDHGGARHSKDNLKLPAKTPQSGVVSSGYA